LRDIWHLVLAVGLLGYFTFWRPRMRERLRRGLAANERLLAFGLEQGDRPPVKKSEMPETVVRR
jgi:hypothetical protein